MSQTSTELRPPLGRTGGVNLRDLLPFLRWRNELARILLTASPIVLIGLLNMAMSIIDIVMLGRYNAEGLATVLIVSDLYSIVFNFSAGFAGVATQQVAAAIGARVRWQVCTIVRRTLLLVLLLGVLGAAAILFSAWILEQLGVRQSEVAADYAAFMAGTYVFMLLFALIRAVFSAMGRPGLALLAIVAAVPLKAAGNYALIYGAWGAPELGVAGAGLASLAVAVLMSTSLMVYLFASPSFAVFDDPEPASLDFRELWRLTRSGFLMGLVAVSETGVFLASTIVIGLFAPNETHRPCPDIPVDCDLLPVRGRHRTSRYHPHGLPPCPRGREPGVPCQAGDPLVWTGACRPRARSARPRRRATRPASRIHGRKRCRSCRPHRNPAAHRRADAGRSDPGPHDHRPAQGAGGRRRSDRIHHRELLGDRADGHAAACRCGIRGAGRLAQPAPRRVRLVGLFFCLSLAAKREQANVDRT